MTVMRLSKIFRSLNEGGNVQKDHRLIHKNIPKKILSELMLAKMTLEEKNELIEEKNRQILELRSREIDLISEMEFSKKSLHKYTKEINRERNKAQQLGIQKVIEDIISILANYEFGLSLGSEFTTDINIKLSERLIGMLKEWYGVEIIDELPERIDPEIHQVIEVVDDPNMDSKIIRLSKGYRIGERVIRPMKVKVIKGKNDSNLKKNISSNLKLFTINSDYTTYDGPKGVA